MALDFCRHKIDQFSNSQYFIVGQCDPAQLANGMVTYHNSIVNGRYLAGSTASLRCVDYTYRLFGRNTLVCSRSSTGSFTFQQMEKDSSLPNFPICGGNRVTNMSFSDLSF